MTSLNRLQFLYIFIVLVSIELTFSIRDLNTNLFITLSLIILIIGLPHGALDHKVAQKHFNLSHGYSKLIFFASYLALGLVFFWFWLIQPLLAFSIFLLLSAIHFGMDFKFSGLSNLKSVISGLAIVSSPVLFQAEQVMDLFSLLTNDGIAKKLVDIILPIAVVSVALSLLIIFNHFKENTINCIELLLTLVAATILNPLIYLTLYFCFSHSMKHYINLYSYLNFQQLLSFIKALLPIFTVSLLFLLPLIYLYNESTLEDLLFKSIMLLILSLTLPHMVIVEFAVNRNSENHN